MKNFVQPGCEVEYTSPVEGVTAGTPVQIGQLVVIPSVTISAEVAAANPTRFNGSLEGVFLVPKATGQTWDEGEIVYWNQGAGYMTTTSTSALRAGIAVAAAANDATTGIVRLDGVAREDGS